MHELTHALQDQNFDLGKRYEELAEADDANSSAASDGFDALVEGDARRIEGKWRDSLSARDRRALDKDQGKGAKDFEAGSKDIPEVLKTMIAAPYELGQAMLAVAVQQGGDRAVDDLFRSPPRPRSSSWTPGRWSLTTRASSTCRSRSWRTARRPWPATTTAARSAPSAGCWSSRSGCPSNRR